MSKKPSSSSQQDNSQNPEDWSGRPEDVAQITGLNERTVRDHYLEFGGIRIGKKYLFNLEIVKQRLEQNALAG